MTGRSRALAAGTLLLVAGATTIVATGALGGSSGASAGSGALPAGQTRATVERRTLADQLTLDGTLSYSDSHSIYNRLSGTYTRLPAVGDTIRRGQALFRLDGLPAVLMYGSVPAYRALRTSMTDGADVLELERNLQALGYGPGTVDDHYDASTAAAVKRWQDAEGLKQTGSVELGRVVFTPSARRVTAVQASTGSSAGGGGAGGGGAATAVLTTTSTRQHVSLAIGADQQQDVYRGQRVAVQLPDGRVFHGRVHSVGRVASTPSAGGDGGGGDSTPTVAVSIRLSRQVARLDQAPVSVTLTRERRRNVLTVPATALLATAGGGYAVQALAGGETRLVAVTPGLFANGYVEVTGRGVRDGMTVTVPR